MGVPTVSAREQANDAAVQRMLAADPVLVDVRPAIDVVPGMTPGTVLVSGAPMPWEAYAGGQRDAVIGAALLEGLASDPEDADARLRSGAISVGGCHDHGCVGSPAGVCTASMPVFVVENRAHGNAAFCPCSGGLEDVVAGVLADAVRCAEDGIALAPIIRRALDMGDELHGRTAAATLLLTRELLPHLLAVGERRPAETRRAVDVLVGDDQLFLGLAMSASKATADAAHDIDGAGIVTAMTLSCREFAIRVSGLGDRWFRTDLPEIEPMGSDSMITETVGLGGFAQAAALSLQDFGGGGPEELIDSSLRMYRIAVAEHPAYRIPALGFRGVPTGIDVELVVATRVRPVMDVGVACRGGQVAAGLLYAPLGCFEQAAAALAERDLELSAT
jgi:hypothetical protein